MSIRIPQAKPLIIIGDHYRDSDVGKFCQRLQQASGENRVVYYNSTATNAIINASEQAYRAMSPATIAINIVNNRYLFSNFSTAFTLVSRISLLCPQSIPRIIGICHDSILDYPAQIAAGIAKGEAIDTEERGKFVGGASAIDHVLDEIMPGHLRGEFASLSKHERGIYLLAFLCRKLQCVICHSEFARDIISDACNRIDAEIPSLILPLAYDIVTSNNTVDSHRRGEEASRGPYLTDCIVIGIYGMFFNSAKQLASLEAIIKRLSELGHNIHVWIAGKESDEVQRFATSLDGVKAGITISLMGFVSDSLLISLIGSSDYIWCYRDPTHGEASGTVLRALSAGACPIISNKGWYDELPKDLVLPIARLDNIDHSAKLVSQYSISQRCPSLREKRIAYISDSHSPQVYVEKVVGFIETQKQGYRNSEGEFFHGFRAWSNNILPSAVYQFSPDRLCSKRVELPQISRLASRVSQALLPLSKKADINLPLASLFLPSIQVSESPHRFPYPLKSRADYFAWVQRNNLSILQPPIDSLLLVDDSLSKCSPFVPPVTYAAHAGELVGQLAMHQEAPSLEQSIKQLVFILYADALSESINELMSATSLNKGPNGYHCLHSYLAGTISSRILGLKLNDKTARDRLLAFNVECTDTFVCIRTALQLLTRFQ